MSESSYRDLAKEHLERIVPVSLYVTTRQRNAWHGTASLHYRGPISLSCTLSEAQAVAEDWRAQGSTFSIEQVPGLHLMSEWSDVIIVEFHSDISFLAWDQSQSDQIRRGAAMTDAIDALGTPGRWRSPRPSEQSFIARLLQPEEAPIPLGSRARFMAWSSVSHGGGYALEWNAHPGRHNASGVRRISRLAQD
ncbi:hypothetical protein [Microbacterium aurum]|uniref:Uncharacterized protein n=1 Tax=Microbacterium aurum TaxID=36805 RepID=A0A1P8U593_9MICO|nr:hypothetical protein [Microbacterium aurum]APZ33274.1 hypothetical protein BOH66_02435 [Microbacterium aurum]MBM7826885.1 hypothetical protein [Microbacterium aurum]